MDVKKNSSHKASGSARTKERREAARRSVREEILAVSREIITKEGFAALTMRKLAERIGYSPAALYLHFRSRDEIAQAVGRSGYADFFLALSAAVADGNGSPAERARSLAEAYVRFGLENPQTYALIFMEDAAYLKAVFAEPVENDPATASYEILIKNAADLMAAGLQLPEIRKPGKPARAVSAVELAESFWASLHGIVSLKLTCPGFPSAPAELLTGVYLDTLLRGLEPSPASSLATSRNGVRARSYRQNQR